MADGKCGRGHIQAVQSEKSYLHHELPSIATSHCGTLTSSQNADSPNVKSRCTEGASEVDTAFVDVHFDEVGVVVEDVVVLGIVYAYLALKGVKLGRHSEGSEGLLLHQRWSSQPALVQRRRGRRG